VKELLRQLVATVMKLPPVLRRIDFYSSESAITTYDGDLKVESKRVVTYKPRSPGRRGTVDARK
jgi:hypothetical protein